MKIISLFFTTCFFPFLTVPLIAQNKQPTDSCQGNTYIRLLGEPGTYERGIALCPAADGNIYVTGSKPDSALIIKCSPAGKIIWTRSIDFFPGYDNITRLSIDSEGMLIGCVHSCSCIQGSGASFFFKYNPQNDKLLWISRPSFFTTNAGDVSGIVEKQPGGNYYAGFFSNVPPGETVIMEIDRQTGLEVMGTSWRYDWGGNSNFRSFIIHESSIYTIGRETSGNSPGNRRQSIVRIDTLNGNPIWSLFSHLSLNQSARLEGEDIIIDGNNLISVYSGNDEGTSQIPGFVFLQKTSLDGNIIWVKKYDLKNFMAETATEVIKVNDGYAIFGSSGVSVNAQDGLFILKTNLDGDALWARHYDYNQNDYVYRAVRDQEFLEMDGFLYFTAYSEDAGGGTDLLLAKLNADGFVDDSCAYLTDTPVETYTITDPVSEKPPLMFQNLDLETAMPLPITETAIPALPEFQTICEHVCESEEGCDIKINDCVKFELLNIVVDAEGNRHYRIRFTNSCAGQRLNYLAVQVPDGTTAAGPPDGSTFTSESGRSYTVRNPNFSPFYSIRFKAGNDGLVAGESDVFEYVLIGQAQPAYINVFARMTPGPSFEAHLNVFNCPVEYQTIPNRNSTARTQISISPNPVTHILSINLSEPGAGQWQIRNLSGQCVQTGNWADDSNITLPVSGLVPGMYFVQLHQKEGGIVTKRFIKME